jgi:hypothetical protein
MIIFTKETKPQKESPKFCFRRQNLYRRWRDPSKAGETQTQHKKINEVISTDSQIVRLNAHQRITQDFLKNKNTESCIFWIIL